jgi:aspartate kinase
MQVFKFGGAAMKDGNGMRQTAEIIKQELRTGTALVVVVSAMGKTTNALEKLTQFATQGRAREAREQYLHIRKFHEQVIQEIFAPEALGIVLQAVGNYFKKLERLTEGLISLGDYPDRIFDRMMAFGELLSSVILYEYCISKGIECLWFDARDLIFTDSEHSKADVIWSLTESSIRKALLPHLQPGKLVITQGYIGATPEGRTTTLGREGSDYSAAVIAACLKAASVTVWKDVAGMLSADPRYFPDKAQLLPQLSYEQALEMSFFGATVIHPRTIKPLQNRAIPLYIKSFQSPAAAGTYIGKEAAALPPCYLRKINQTLLTLRPRDLSFIDTNRLQQILQIIGIVRFSIQLIQLSANVLYICTDTPATQISEFTARLADTYYITQQTNLRLEAILYAQQLQAPENALLVQRTDNNLFWLEK